MDTSPSTLRLALGRARTAGLSFDDAWGHALASLRGPGRTAWVEVLSGCRDAYQRAYDQAPATSAELALSQIAASTELVDLSERVCAHCGGPIDPHRDERALFCKDACRAAAWREGDSRVPGGSSLGPNAQP